jgi:uncharacterized membrane protein (UPF0127 family)
MQNSIKPIHKYQLAIIILALIILIAGGFLARNYLNILQNNGIVTSSVAPKLKLDMDKVEVVSSLADREKGLMNRTSLCNKCGMLFVFETEQSVGFWMKDTLISLDMIFLTENGQITNIERGAEPNNTTKIYNSASPVKYVLETNDNFSDQNKLQTGQYLDVDWLKNRN